MLECLRVLFESHAEPAGGALAGEDEDGEDGEDWKEECVFDDGPAGSETLSSCCGLKRMFTLSGLDVEDDADFAVGDCNKDRRLRDLLDVAVVMIHGKKR